MNISIPKVYPILDSSVIPAVGRSKFLEMLGKSLADAGVLWLEYRNKTGTDAEVMADSKILRAVMPAGQVKLILDDRVDLVAEAGFDGVHVDAGDASPRDARKLLGHDRIVGTFGGSYNLIPGILAEPANYLAIGPVYLTTTKQTSRAPIGVEGVRRLRAEARPEAVLVAAAGITFETAPMVLAAGSSSVAVAAAIFRAADPAREFRRWKEQIEG